MYCQIRMKILHCYLTDTFKVKDTSIILSFIFKYISIGFICYHSSHVSAEARQYVTGVTWHGYGGDYDTPAKVHNEYPDIGILSNGHFRTFPVIIFSLKMSL